MKRKSLSLLLSLSYLLILTNIVHAKEKDIIDNIYEERLALYQKIETVTQIPWYYIAAIDQYERNIHTDVSKDQLISIKVEDHLWYGDGNLDKNQDERIIALFQGIGKDGDGDGLADPENPEDVLYTIGHLITTYGISEDDIKIALFDYYKRDLNVKTIINTARIFEKYQAIDLPKRDFPVSIHHNYSYRSTWGVRRGFGGARIHEGTDIFANYGTPVKATTYGVIELMGWNLYGGWRIGIRDIHNIYHYYAHLNRFEEGLQVGQIVEPGDILGTVGSSGYGPPGTHGKFPPHLHYGMYKDNGHSEWSFDPYPYLRRWEQMAKQK